MELKEILKAARERLHVENLTPWIFSHLYYLNGENFVLLWAMLEQLLESYRSVSLLFLRLTSKKDTPLLS